VALGEAGDYDLPIFARPRPAHHRPGEG
jgi:hypothetical protein